MTRNTPSPERWPLDILTQSVSVNLVLASLTPTECVAHLVLNVLFTQALADHLPRSTPLVPTSVNPGYCYSELRRNLVNKFTYHLLFSVQDLLFGRTSEQGARQLIWAALGPDGKEGKHADYLRGAYVSTQHIKEPSDFAISKEGREAQDRIWVRV